MKGTRALLAVAITLGLIIYLAGGWNPLGGQTTGAGTTPGPVGNS